MPRVEGPRPEGKATRDAERSWKHARRPRVTVILHIITGLGVGGAELMLERLVEAHRRNPALRHVVVSLTNLGEVGRKLRAQGVEVEALGMRSVRDLPGAIWRLRSLVRSIRPDVVQTWLYHANVIGGLVAKMSGRGTLIWGIRGSGIPQSRLSSMQALVVLSSWLSRHLPDLIVCCAESARSAHVELGYYAPKMVVVPNGYDLTELVPSAGLRKESRSSFGFAEQDLVIGIVARYDPLKDFPNFVAAASSVAANVPNCRILMVGRGLDSRNIELNALLERGGQAHRFVLAGERRDVPRCLAAMDVFCLSSRSEGFPNVVSEAMAMRIPCVVTDAGDAAQIVADTGIVVPIQDSAALADGLRAMVGKSRAERAKLGQLARERIETNYSIETAAKQFQEIYERPIRLSRLSRHVPCAQPASPCR